MFRTVSNHLRLSKQQYKIVDTLAYHSKSLYNVGLYNIRQHYVTIQENTVILNSLRPDLASGIPPQIGSFLPYTRSKKFPYTDISNYTYSKTNENYLLLHSDPAQQTLQNIDTAYRSYFKLFEMYKAGNLAFRPGLPKYLPKDGRYSLTYPRAHLKMKNGYVFLGISRAFKKQHGLNGKELKFKIPAQIHPNQIRVVRVVPICNGKTYKIEFVYEVSKCEREAPKTNYLAIDLGLDNFATIVDNVTGTATILDGKYLKSVNRRYNKENAKLQSIKDKQGLKSQFTARQSRLLCRRNNQINEAMNRFVAYIVKYAHKHDIGTVVLPTWDGIKQEISHGRKNNQNFVQIPYAKFRRKLKAKCECAGIIYDDSHDEAYTSQVDALSGDPIKKPAYGRTRRVKRGLYQSSTGTQLNADVNGAINHMRKVAGDSVLEQIISRGRVNRPVRIRDAYEEPNFVQIKLQSNLTGRIASPAL